MREPALKNPKPRHSADYRLGTASRVAAALLGGYALTSLLIVFSGYVMPGNKARVVLGGSLAGFAVWAGAVMWVFAARTASRAWLGLLAAGAVPGVAVWYFKLRGGA